MKRIVIFLLIFTLQFSYSDDFWDYFNTGYEYYEAQDYDRAIKYFEMAYAYNPHEFNVNLMLSVTYLYLNNIENAEMYCNNALAISLDDETAKRMLSAILIAKMGDFEFSDQAAGDYITNEHVTDKSCIYIEDIPLFIERGILEIRGTKLENAGVCAEYNIIAHNTPRDGSPWDRLQAAGLDGAAQKILAVVLLWGNL